MKQPIVKSLTARPLSIMISLVTILTIVLVLVTHHQVAAKLDLTVDLGYAKYTGFRAVDTEIAKWLGIRFAAPPVGNLRFKAPQPPLVNDKIQMADKVCQLFFSIFHDLITTVWRCLSGESFPRLF